MRFELSERITSYIPQEKVLECIEEQFRRISMTLTRQGDRIVVKYIQASFGGIR